ncbi:hypothetical protein RI129_001818 [Pyrocoelia pectoralis]|uniref:Uncharacterized protein n=1 Tax=Pyrocoelia pectoralis TaxID=417401 RepID=A0AAN7VWF6_9COLE
MIVRTAALYFLYALVSVNCDNTKFPDYYWREYNGNIPHDAIPGGLDQEANPTYIGQVYLGKTGLLPATIKQGFNSALTSAGGKTIEAKQIENIKILCSSDQSKLKWVTTRCEDKRLFNGNCHVVNGGSEGGQIVHIGRTCHDSQIIIGRVFSFYEHWRGLWIPHNGGNTHFWPYEILTFDCNDV